MEEGINVQCVPCECRPPGEQTPVEGRGGEKTPVGSYPSSKNECSPSHISKLAVSSKLVTKFSNEGPSGPTPYKHKLHKCN